MRLPHFSVLLIFLDLHALPMKLKCPITLAGWRVPSQVLVCFGKLQAATSALCVQRQLMHITLFVCACVLTVVCSSQAAEAVRSALSAEQAKTLKLETQVAELTEKLGSVQVRVAGSSRCMLGTKIGTVAQKLWRTTVAALGS